MKKTIIHEDKNGIIRGSCSVHGEFIGFNHCPVCFELEEEYKSSWEDER